MNNFGGLRCTACGAELELIIAFDGCDWNAAAGEGSGFDYCVDLACSRCPRVYPIGHVRKEEDFSETAAGKGVVNRLSKM